MVLRAPCNQHDGYCCRSHRLYRGVECHLNIQHKTCFLHAAEPSIFYTHDICEAGRCGHHHTDTMYQVVPGNIDLETCSEGRHST